MAGVYAQWLVVWWFAGFVNSPMIRIIPILGQQQQLLAYEVALFVTRTASIPIGAMIGNDLTAVAMYSAVSTVFNLCLFVYLLRIVMRANFRTHVEDGGAQEPSR